MQMELPNASVYLDIRRKKQNGLFPVKLRVYYKEQRKLYPTEFELSEETFERSYGVNKPRQEYKELKRKLVALETKANESIAELKSFSFPAFEKKMFRANSDRNNVIYHYEQYIGKLKEQSQIGTAESYQQSLKSIKAFLKSNSKQVEIKKLPFEQITPDFLNQYENWMEEQGRSKTTVGIYLRPLRAVFNAAIEEGDIEKELYPFSRRKYKVPAGRNIKKALNREALKALFHYPLPENSHREKARDFWFLSYNCNGINVRDIAELKFKNLRADVIVFLRTKTKNTTKSDSKPIVVPLTDFIRQIIVKYGNANSNPENYIFPIFKSARTEEEKRVAVKNFTRFINQHIKPVGKAVGITDDISTYWARHSFTTMAIRNGASMEYIQESLGHNDLKTTINYWGGFEENVKREIADKLMDF